MSEIKYIAPTKFCSFPSIGYWELNGHPVSSQEAEYGKKKGAIWKKSELSRDIEQHIGSLREI